MMIESSLFIVSIKTKSETIKLGEAIMLELAVSNISNNTHRFCKYHTPFEGIQNNIFNLWYGKKQISYAGKMKKRIPPQETDYLYLNSKQTISCVCQLDGYLLKKKGIYKIQYTGNLISGLPTSNIIQVALV